MDFIKIAIPIKKLKINSIWFYSLVSFLVFFTTSSIRHILFQSSDFDLGIFDNGIYLISQGQKPIVTFRNLHILGDHSALILYIIALFYVIIPSVYWLFFIQALSLSLAIIPIYHLGKLAKLNENKSKIVCLIYLLYPLIFNVNLFDFHPEVIAIPFIFLAILSSQLNQLKIFIFAIVIILSCKAVLSLTVFALGIWLIICEKKKIYGFIAIFSGIFWFIFTTQLIIPKFNNGQEATAVERYAFLGDSVQEIALNLVVQPQLILSSLFTLTNLEYLALLFLPVIFTLSWRYSYNLIPAIPTIFLNLITNYQAHKDLVHQYSLAIIPFFIITIIPSLANKKSLIRNNKYLLIYSIIGFLALAKYGYFFDRYWQYIDNWQESHQAIRLINTKENVLTVAQYSPHLTHRQIIEVIKSDRDLPSLNQFEYVLINSRYPGFGNNQETVNKVINKAENNSSFRLIFQEKDVFLFKNLD